MKSGLQFVLGKHSQRCLPNRALPIALCALVLVLLLLCGMDKSFASSLAAAVGSLEVSGKDIHALLLMAASAGALGQGNAREAKPHAIEHSLHEHDQGGNVPAHAEAPVIHSPAVAPSLPDLSPNNPPAPTYAGHFAAFRAYSGDSRAPPFSSRTAAVDS
ncbi:hypothetical protein IT571_01920 [Candidatus Sumerlaeota bacterium]|nr:hypothetical protein [Candidatus Sumerlaeota bacterium]